MSRHLLIAGTGRAGTSFLVRYLAKLGLDTQLSRTGADANWDDAANAGLETLLLPGAADLPYVIKSPWTYQVIHQALAAGSLQFDAVIMPMRDLTEAAASRSIIEIQHLHDELPWMGDLEQTWEHYGHTPGGIVYSLSPIDQARLLAVGFHQLLERLVRADIPIILLSFPRLIENADYLYQKLASLLPPSIAPDTARSAHAEVAEPSKVRVRAEIGDPASGFVLDGPGQGRLERAALLRIIANFRAEREDLQQRLADAIAEIRGVREARDLEVAQHHAMEEVAAAMAVERDRAAEQRRATEQALQRMTEAHGSVERELETVRGSLRTFLRTYLPLLRRHLFP